MKKRTEKMKEAERRNIKFSFWLALLIVNLRESIDPHDYDPKKKVFVVQHVENDLSAGNLSPYFRFLKTVEKDPEYEIEVSSILVMLDAVCGKGVVRHEMRKVS